MTLEEHTHGDLIQQESSVLFFYNRERMQHTCDSMKARISEASDMTSSEYLQL